MKYILILLSIMALPIYGQQVTTTNLLVPGELADATEGGQGELNVAALTGQAKVVMMAKSSAGTSPTLAAKLQTSAPLSRGEYSLGSGATVTGIRTGATTNVKVAAKFTLAAAKSLKNVYVRLARKGALAAGTITMTIEGNSSTVPDGTAVATVTADVANVVLDDDGYSNVQFSIPKPLDLAAGTYWICLASDYTASSSDQLVWQTTAVGSGGNAATHNNTSWSAVATSNLSFYTEQYSFADITGGAFTGITTTGSVQTLEFPIDNLGVIRPFVAIGGTDTPAYYVGMAVLAKPE